MLGGRTLAAEASAVDALLAAGDLAAARRRLTHLVGRRTEQLDEAEIARAVIESVAENTSDAVVAPLFWGAVAGLPGLLAYRAVNTLDAMVGHHSPRYERFGWASARADDIANYLPARLTAAAGGRVAPRWRAAAGVPRWPYLPQGRAAAPQPERRRLRVGLSPGHWGCGSAGATTTAPALRTAPSSARRASPRPGDIGRAARRAGSHRRLRAGQPGGHGRLRRGLRGVAVAPGRPGARVVRYPAMACG